MMDGFAAVNGTRLYYEIAGSGPPLVLIHGHGLDCRMWDDQFAPFAAHHRVVRYDLRGFGKSDPVGDTMYAHEDDLAALLDHLEIARAMILGLSAGGSVAINFALTYPAMARALIVVDTALGGHAWSENWNARWKALRQTARAGGAPAANEGWLAHPLFASANEHPAVATRLRQMIADYSGWHWGTRDPQRGHEPPAAERLGEIATPTLVMLGERDLPDFHAIADRIAEQIPAPTARKIILPGVGHMANMEAPERFNAEVLDFLASIR
ncbi:MAG: alpha/beta fold hydrolase [Chloroflexota bacterium]|nr:alpha/beta fold hydrolase [Chloroflexota bacterium]